MAVWVIRESSYEPVPAGAYTCIFEGLDEDYCNDFGPAIRWLFKIADGPHKDRTLSVFCDKEQAPATNNKKGRYLSALSGKPLKGGTEADPYSYVGQRYVGIVNAEGKLESFTPQT